MIGSAQVAVDDSPAVLLSSTAAEAVGGVVGQHVAITSCDVDIYLGGSGVTEETGALLPAGTPFAMDLERGEQLYAICASGVSGTAHVLRSGK